jgi:hypothetical protein
MKAQNTKSRIFFTAAEFINVDTHSGTATEFLHEATWHSISALLILATPVNNNILKKIFALKVVILLSIKELANQTSNTSAA